jgi:GPH family glycoside/pentoside/hexuronide:cation symporter
VIHSFQVVHEWRLGKGVRDLKQSPKPNSYISSLKINPITRWIYGSAGVSYGVVDNAHYFTLLYYSQVLGLDARLAGLALGIGLVFDAITDPLVGYLSDNTKSRWGRRHPFLYASVLPLALSYFLLWHPPPFVQGDTSMFGYLVLCLVALRGSLTLFLVPATAMCAEITSDYDERTRLFARYSTVQSVLGNAMSVLMYALWLVPTPEYADGIMNVQGYKVAGLVGTLAIAATILLFTIRFHRFIPRFSRFQPSDSLGLKQFFRQVADVFRYPSMRMVVVSWMLYYAGSGIYAMLWVYIYSYFWEFTSQQISLIVIPMALAGLLLPPLLSGLASGREKKRVAVLGMLAATLVNVFPIGMRLLGIFPANGIALLFWILLVLGVFETVFFLVFDVASQSMTVDITEQAELDTTRRSEGVITSAVTFASKCAYALGTFLGGVTLSLIEFPTETTVGDVAPDIIFDLGLVYGPLILVIFLGSAYAISRYQISRSQYEEMVARLEGR